jgi:hypothetical protein
MRLHTFPLISAAALGFATAAVAFTLWAPRRADAQFKGAPPLGQLGGAAPSNANPAAIPQPIEIQALAPDTFVVATREPRLVHQVGREGTAQNMLLTVVTHYTVKGDRLIPVEHVRVPAGYRSVTIEE